MRNRAQFLATAGVEYVRDQSQSGESAITWSPPCELGWLLLDYHLPSIPQLLKSKILYTINTLFGDALGSEQALFTQQTSIFGFVCSTKQKGLAPNLEVNREKPSYLSAWASPNKIETKTWRQDHWPMDTWTSTTFPVSLSKAASPASLDIPLPSSTATGLSMATSWVFVYRIRSRLTGPGTSGTCWSRSYEQ